MTHRRHTSMSSWCPRPTPRGTVRRRAFTLLEVVLASVILAIIGGAVSAVMMVACRAIPSSAGGSASAVELSEVTAQMSVELSFATSVLALDAFYVTFVGPDIDGDGTGDEIAYAFNSSEGTLLRQVAGEYYVWIDGLEDCEFTFVTGTEEILGEDRTLVRSVGFRAQPSDGAEIRSSFSCAALPEAP
jgi:prepilin-type N-terminal cleavage/methylation domain-containing protein